MVTFEGDKELIEEYAGKLKVPKGISKVILKRKFEASTELRENGICLVEMTPDFPAKEISEMMREEMKPDPDYARLRKRTRQWYLKKRKR